MSDFLKKFESDMDKMLSCASGESIVKPFDQIYEEVRDKQSRGRLPQLRKRHKKYSEKEESIYKQVIEEFLNENPEISGNLGE